METVIAVDDNTYAVYGDQQFRIVRASYDLPKQVAHVELEPRNEEAERLLAQQILEDRGLRVHIGNPVRVED